MTSKDCPQGCGGTVDEAVQSWCSSCRRGIHEVRLKPPNTCWEWFGDLDHRMKCRRTLGHADDHDTHADSEEEDIFRRVIERGNADMFANQHLSSTDVAVKIIDALAREIARLRGKVELPSLSKRACDNPSCPFCAMEKQ